jgi:hypothetical protein
MRRYTSALFIVMALAASAGCGEGNHNTAFSTGLDGGKTLGALTPTEANLLCKASEDYRAKTFAPQTDFEMECRAKGILQSAATAGDEAQMRSACQTAYDECKNGLVAITCKTPSAACAVTVAEYEACYQQMVAAYASLPTCDKMTAISAQVLSSAPAACQPFQTKCPEMGTAASN